MLSHQTVLAPSVGRGTTTPIARALMSPARRRKSRAAPTPLGTLEPRALLAAGALDLSFGGAGTGTVQVGSITAAGIGGGSQQLAVVPATDPAGNAGKILVAGSLAASGSPSHFAVARFNADGSYDATWGGSGTVSTAFGNDGEGALCVTVQPDGKVVVGGWTRTLVPQGKTTWKNDNFALVRYNSSGTLDTSFGVGGKVTTDLPGGYAGIYNAGLQSVAGVSRIVAIGSSGCDSTATVVRYSSGGVLDGSFGSGGLATVSGVNGQNAGGAVQPDGSILAAGVLIPDPANPTATKQLMAVARFRPDGQPDASFNGTGLATAEFPDHAGAYALALQPDGAIVLGGSARVTAPTPHSVFALARFTPGGQLDPTFDDDGLVMTESIDSQIFGLGIQPDGKIVAVGSGLDDVVARYLGDDPSPLTTASATSVPPATSPAKPPVIADPRPPAGMPAAFPDGPSAQPRRLTGTLPLLQRGGTWGRAARRYQTYAIQPFGALANERP